MYREIQQMSVNDIIPYDDNARMHGGEQVQAIAASIREYGFTDPILVDGGNVLVAGHGRLMAAKLVGMQEVPVIVLEDLTPEQIKAYRIADNKLAEGSTWDIDLLMKEVQELVDDGFRTESLGFSDMELFSIHHQDTPVEETEDVDALWKASGMPDMPSGRTIDTHKVTMHFPDLEARQAFFAMLGYVEDDGITDRTTYAWFPPGSDPGREGTTHLRVVQGEDHAA